MITANHTQLHNTETLFKYDLKEILIDSSYRNSFKVSDQYTNRVSCHTPNPLFSLNLKSLFNPIIATLEWVVSRPEMSRECGQKSVKFSYSISQARSPHR